MPKPPKYFVRDKLTNPGKQPKKETALAKYCKSKKISQKSVAEAADISLANFCRIWNGEADDMLLSTAKRISNFLNQNLHKLFKDVK